MPRNGYSLRQDPIIVSLETVQQSESLARMVFSNPLCTVDPGLGKCFSPRPGRRTPYTGLKTPRRHSSLLTNVLQSCPHKWIFVFNVMSRRTTFQTDHYPQI